MRACATRPGSFLLAACAAASSLLGAGCDASARGSDAALVGDPPAVRCARGHVLGPGGACMPVGIQGCADLFVEDDALCHPAMAKCPPGTIPKFDEGCIPVGIPRCAPEFVGDDGLCRPTMAACPAGTFAVPEAGCVPVDGPAGCGRGRWGDIPRGPGTLHVDPSYAGVDGDGSEARPLTTIAAALDRAADGATIALAEGTYDEPLVLTRPVAIAGRCASRVHLRGVSPRGDPPAVVSALDAGEVTLRGVEIGGDGAGVVATGASVVALERVHLRNALHVGVLAVAGARLSVAQSWIEGTRSGGAFVGAGAAAGSGGALSVKESAITGNRGAGVAARQARTTAAVLGSLIEGTLRSSLLDEGQGIVAGDGAAATVEGTAIVGNRVSGILATTGASVTLSGALVEGTIPGPDGVRYGVGVHAVTRARVAIDASVILGNTEIGVAVLGGGTAAEVSRSLIQDTLAASPASPLGGLGVAIARGASMRLRDSAVVRNRAAGVHVGDLSAELVAEGNLVEGTLAGGVWGSGAGVTVLEGRATLASNAIRGNEGAGVSVAYAGSEATLTGNLVEGHVAPDRGVPVGQGIVVFRGASAALAGNVVSGNRSVGVLVGAEEPGGEVEMTGDLVQDTWGDAADGSAGFGIAAAGYKLRLASALIRRSRAAGVALFAAEADVTGTAVDGVTGDRRTRAPLRDRPGDLAGDGVLALAGSVVDLRGVRVTGCARAGILYDRSSGHLAGVHASGNLFGLVTQGSPVPRVEADKESVFTGNFEADELLEGDLPVPPAAPLP
ncbi:nuclease [Sorangium cellulosum]|uniref:Nuclease n=1 Tax=Sorangium cellulosum TaxID=56 RepID=A0A2L0EX47_SORCE|nr:right-handed parallel beta-helix repeat-containing protein [Sorangium cellulosum]AUX43871.1 nuclease [Sorangium cellulosum]